jgi:endonuclease/exonuclease/phosphatase family metal-dependent hydrolase
MRPTQKNDVFHAIAHPARRAILVTLKDGERAASELAEPFRMTFAAISQHLRVLEEADLVSVRRVPARAEAAAGRGDLGGRVLRVLRPAARRARRLPRSQARQAEVTRESWRAALRCSCMSGIRLVTWNIQKGMGVDFRRDLQRTAAALGAMDADVVALQEVLRTRATDQAATLGRALGIELAWGPARTVRGGTYGNALLVRGGVRDVRVHDISVARCERRALLEAEADVRGTRLRVFVCHLGLGARERALQIEQVMALVRASAARGVPRILLGDFNEWKRGPVSAAIAREFPEAPAALPTHPSPWPLFALDRIAWDSPLRGTVHVMRVGVASDHRALRAYVEAGQWVAAPNGHAPATGRNPLAHAAAHRPVTMSTS